MESQIGRLLRLVLQWGDDRNLTAPENLKAQTFKLMSELGEVASGMLVDDPEETSDGIGDVLVVAIIIGKQLGRPLTEELFEARTRGEMIYHADSLLGAVESIGLLADNVLKGQLVEAAMQLRVFAQSICDFAHTNGYGAAACLEGAYETIKDRKGVMFNGAYIKESDPRYESAKAELAALKDQAQQ